MEKKKNTAASVRAKLLNQSRETGEELQNLLMRFAVKRLLYRLSLSVHKNKFLLKGAVLFSFRFSQPHRPTKDLDLLASGASDIPTLETILREICEIDGADGLEFLAESVKGANFRFPDLPVRPSPFPLSNPTVFISFKKLLCPFVFDLFLD